MDNPLDYLQRRLEGRNLSEVSRRAGMSRDNVSKLARGTVNDVYISTVVRLSRVLDRMDEEAVNDPAP